MQQDFSFKPYVASITMHRSEITDKDELATEGEDEVLKLKY